MDVDRGGKRCNFRTVVYLIGAAAGNGNVSYATLKPGEVQRFNFRKDHRLRNLHADDLSLALPVLSDKQRIALGQLGAGVE